MSVVKAPFLRPHRRFIGDAAFSDFVAVGELQFHVPTQKRTFDYRALGAAVGNHKANKLARVHIQYISKFKRSTALAHFYALNGLAKSISTNAAEFRDLHRCKSLNNGKGASLWQKAVKGYVREMESLDRAVTSFVEEFGNLYRTLDEFSSCGLAAKCTRPPLPKNYHAAGGHRPTLVEQSGKRSVSQALVDNIIQRFRELRINSESIEVEHLIRALAANVPYEILTDEVALAEAIFNLNAKALNDLRKLAEDTLIQWRDVWEKGQELLNRSNPGMLQAVKSLSTLSNNEKFTEIERLFSPNLGDEARANFAQLILETHGPIAPPYLQLKWPARVIAAFNKLGGRYYFDAYFSLHRRGVAAAILLYLVDSGANVSTALTLSTNSEQNTDNANSVSFHSYKDRAGPEPIVKYLLITDPAVRVTAAQALRDVLRMTQTRRDQFPKVGDDLFITTYFSEPSPVNYELLGHSLKYMLRDTLNENTRWTPSAIRASVALDISGRNTGNLAEVARQLNHVEDSTSTQIYGLKFAVRLVLTNRIREFTTLLEISFSTHSTLGPLVLNYPSQVASHLLKKAHKTGLGFLCKDPSVQGGSSELAEPSCPQLGKCPQCSSHLYVVTVQHLAETIALHDALALQAEEFEESRSTQWKEDWLILYAHSIALLKMIKRSKFAYMLPKAKKLAAKIGAEGFNPMHIKL